MKTTKLFALVLALFLLALPLTSCTLGADGDLAARLDSMEALISQQKATIEGLNAKLTEQSSTIAGLNAKLGEQSSTIAGQNTIINGLNTQIFEQNTAIGDLNSKLAEQNAIIAGQNSTIEGLNNTVTEQGSTIEGLNTQISNQNATIDGQNATIEDLNNTVSEQDSTIEDLNTKLSSQDSVISNLESQVSNLEESKPQTKTVILDEDNYLSYLSFNVTFGEMQRIEEFDETIGSTVRYVCKMTVTTRAAMPGMTFKLAYITYNFDASNMLTIADKVWQSVGTKWCDQTVDIAADGYSEATFYIWCSPVYSFTSGGQKHYYNSIPPLPNTFSNIPVDFVIGLITIKE